MTRNKKIIGKVFTSSRGTPGLPYSWDQRADHVWLFVPSARKPRNSFQATLSNVYGFPPLFLIFYLYSGFIILWLVCFHCKAASNPHGPCSWQELNKYLNKRASVKCMCSSEHRTIRELLLRWPLSTGEPRKHWAPMGTDVASPLSSCHGIEAHPSCLWLSSLTENPQKERELLSQGSNATFRFMGFL